jgi:UTP:GlnB (protein PII) uridylyltransferase
MTNLEKTDALVREYFESFRGEGGNLTITPKKISHELQLKQRKDRYIQAFIKNIKTFQRMSASEILSSDNSWELLKKYSSWSDAWVIFTWYYVLEESPLLITDFLDIGEQKLSFLGSSILQLKNKIEELKGYLEALDSDNTDPDPAEYSYCKQSLDEAEAEEKLKTTEYKILEEVIPLLPHTKIDHNHILEGVLIFARGGYGRKELTFSSDLDLGYCCDVATLSNVELAFTQELIKRMEELFHEIPWDIASQYFELGENLSRFAQTEMMHTIPAILESRPIYGNSKNLVTLKVAIRQVCTEEQLIRFFQKQLDKIKPEKQSDIFQIKDGFGGIRHLQFILWMALCLFRLKRGDSRSILRQLEERGLISYNNLKHLFYALELYNDLRHFLGLHDFFQEKLAESDHEIKGGCKELKNDQLDDQSCMAFLKLKERFTTVDSMDRARLHSINTVSSTVKSVVEQLLNHTVEEPLKEFLIIRHLGSNQIIKFKPVIKDISSAWNIQLRTKKNRENERLLTAMEEGSFFLNLEYLFELFIYISRTGNRLNDILIDKLSALVPRFYELDLKDQTVELKKFIYLLFQQAHASVAIGQLLEIAAPLNYQGESKTLLGLFLPPVNQMRYLLRNIETHEYPLCIHSLKALAEAEKQIINSQKSEPELWKFISKDDIFALKWSTFFHDIGKINPYKNHEELGPVICSEMLTDLGWDKCSEFTELIRLLVRNHQSVVRFSRLSTFLDVGIMKFFELAERSPRKVILLYLINLCDFKSVNAQMSHKTGQLETFFKRTLNILEEFKGKYLSGTLNEIVNNYLDGKVEKSRVQVLEELLLRQCCNKSLEDALLTPLSAQFPEEAEQIKKQVKILQHHLHFIQRAELDSKTLSNHRLKFNQIINRTLPIDIISILVAPYIRSCNWFFTALPNRFLLSTTAEILTTQLIDFTEHRDSLSHFSIIQGGKDEYDTLLFCGAGGLKFHSKIAYVLGRMGMNIENGKINTVVKEDKKRRIVGFFQISRGEKRKNITGLELETLVANLSLPPLTFSPNQVVNDLNVRLSTFKENKKGYLVYEADNNRYLRKKEKFIAVKLSLFDAPHCYFKIIQAFDKLNIIPHQVTITTIGKQIVDYFYLSLEDQNKFDQKEFHKLIDQYLQATL